MADRIGVGKSGEEEAVRFLEKQGYRIIERNFRCRLGEIDIIARDGRTTAFIEVKTRGGDSFGTPKASVDLRKQRKITLASSVYIEQEGLSDSDLRFDVVSIEMKDGRARIELIKDAFEAADI